MNEQRIQTLRQTHAILQAWSSGALTLDEVEALLLGKKITIIQAKLVKYTISEPIPMTQFQDEFAPANVDQ